MQHKFTMDLLVASISVTEISGYAIIETNEFDPDDGWSVGDIWLEGMTMTGTDKKPAWSPTEVKLPQDGENSVENTLAEAIVNHLVNEHRDDISEAFDRFQSDTRETSGERRYDADKHAGV
jgi:hypothetical protein